MKIINVSKKVQGPKTDPCCKPQVIFEIIDAKPLIDTNCYSQLNMVQNLCFLIHIFHNDIIYSTECYDPQYQKPSEGEQKYHKQSYHQELSLFLLSDLLEQMKLNSAAKSQTEGNIYCCFYQEICRCWMIKRLAYSLSITTLLLFLCTGPALTTFSMDGKPPGEKDRLNISAR